MADDWLYLTAFSWIIKSKRWAYEKNIFMNLRFVTCLHLRHLFCSNHLFWQGSTIVTTSHGATALAGNCFVNNFNSLPGDVNFASGSDLTDNTDNYGKGSKANGSCAEIFIHNKCDIFESSICLAGNITSNTTSSPSSAPTASPATPVSIPTGMPTITLVPTTSSSPTVSSGPTVAAHPTQTSGKPTQTAGPTHHPMRRPTPKPIVRPTSKPTAKPSRKPVGKPNHPSSSLENIESSDYSLSFAYDDRSSTSKSGLLGPRLKTKKSHKSKQKKSKLKKIKAARSKLKRIRSKGGIVEVEDNVHWPANMFSHVYHESKMSLSKSKAKLGKQKKEDTTKGKSSKSKVKTAKGPFSSKDQSKSAKKGKKVWKTKAKRIIRKDTESGSFFCPERSSQTQNTNQTKQVGFVSLLFKM